MENKKTTELLDLLQNLDEDKDFVEDGKYEKIMEELKVRYPFFDILDASYEKSLPAVWEVIDELKVEIKKLKRHKHGENGDVLIRI